MVLSMKPHNWQCLSHISAFTYRPRRIRALSWGRETRRKGDLVQTQSTTIGGSRGPCPAALFATRQGHCNVASDVPNDFKSPILPCGIYGANTGMTSHATIHATCRDIWPTPELGHIFMRGRRLRLLGRRLLERFRCSDSDQHVKK